MKKLFLLLILLAVTTNAGTINVPGDYADIQTAINNASILGDTVLVAPGRYYENIRFYGKNVVVASNYIISNDPADILATIIDGSQYSHIDSAATVSMIDGETNAAEFVGFVVTGGEGSIIFGPREGGGINIDHASPTIRNNVIVGNNATALSGGTYRGGGGLNIRNSSTLLRDNIIMWNKGYHYAGGLLIQQQAINVENNIIAQNDGGFFTGTYLGGGGVYNYVTAGAVKFFNNVVADNYAARCGGIRGVTSGNAHVRNCIVRNNSNDQILLTSTSSVAFQSLYSNIEGGYSGFTIDNIDDTVEFSERYEILSTSTSVDAGDTTTIYNDIEDTLNIGYAQSPSYGTIRNDLGVYGGPTPLMKLPIATYLSPIFTILNPSVINYTEPDSLQPVTVDIVVKNEGIAPGIIDSITSNSAGVLLPATSVKLLFEDTLQVMWTPTIFDDITDTLNIYHNDPNLESPQILIFNYTPPNCCRGIRGNVDNDTSDMIDISDLVYLVDYMFSGGAVPSCDVEANIDADAGGTIDISDLVSLVDFMFSGGPAPLACS